MARHLPVERIAPWVLRGLWVALPFTAGPSLGDALDAASRPVQLVSAVGLWLAWGAGVLATVLALPVSLTIVRVLAPAGVVAAVAAALGGHGSALALGWTVVTLAWAFTPTVGSICVNGPAYPNERRFLLRVPGKLLAGPLAVAWALGVAGAASGPLLLAARVWVGGSIATVAGVPLAGALFRGIHELSRRWAVFVPAGLVMHDPLTVVDPVLLPRASIVRLGPASRANAGGALDLSQKAPGLVLEIVVEQDVPLALVRVGKKLGDAVTARRFLVTPTRPGALLEEARRRRFRTA